jgi:hypothetical protein
MAESERAVRHVRLGLRRRVRALFALPCVSQLANSWAAGIGLGWFAAGLIEAVSDLNNCGALKPYAVVIGAQQSAQSAFGPGGSSRAPHSWQSSPWGCRSSRGKSIPRGPHVYRTGAFVAADKTHP